MLDFIQNGKATGDVASTLMQHNFDAGSLRPWSTPDGRAFVTLNQYDPNSAKIIENHVPVTNAPATLRKDDWIQLDSAVIKAAKPRLRAVADVRGAGLTYNIPNGMGKTVLQYEDQSDINAATISMDGLREGQSDRPQYELKNLPLPIIHKDFQFSARQIMTSRNSGTPLDTTTAELAGRRVAEEAEKLLIGTAASYTYGGGTIYGLINHPNRLTKSLTAPTGSNGPTVVREVLEMRKQSTDAYHYGPWMLYISPDYAEYMDDDYSTTKGGNTLRQRIRAIDGITDVRTLDYLTGNTAVLVQMTSNVIREVVGMDLVTVQWESHGGMQINFKVMAILVPQIRADQNGNTGIVHGSV